MVSSGTSICYDGAASTVPSIALLSKTVVDGGPTSGVVFWLADYAGIFTSPSF